MNKAEFDKMIDILSANYRGFSLPPSKRSLWENALEPLETKKVMENVKKCIETSREYPMLPDLRKGLNRQDGWVDQWKIITENIGAKHLDSTAKKIYDIIGLKYIDNKAELFRKWKDFERLYKELSPSGSRKEIDFEKMKNTDSPKEEAEDEEEPMDFWSD